LLDLLDLLLELGALLHVNATLRILLLLFAIFDDGLFLELANMACHALEIFLKLSDLRVGLKQVFRVQVAIGADLLVKIKLEFEFGLSFEVLLLQLSD